MAAALACLLGSTMLTQAQTSSTWVGIDANWSTNTNWLPNTVPGGIGSTALFGPSLTTSINLPNGGNVGGMSFTGEFQSSAGTSVSLSIGGSGAGVKRFDGLSQLRTAMAAEIDSPDGLRLGLDSTALVQEFIPAQDSHIVRVEVLNGKYLYAIKVHITGETFDLCPADICGTKPPAPETPWMPSSGVYTFQVWPFQWSTP